MRTLLDSLITAIGRWTVRVGAVALLAFGAVTVISVVVRFFGGAVTGGAEINEMLVICMAAMSLVAATVFESHPRVTMLIDHLREPARRRMLALVALVSGVFWALAAFVSGRVAVENLPLDERTDLLGIPIVPFRWFWTAALVMVAFILIVRAVRADEAQSGSDPDSSSAE